MPERSYIIDVLLQNFLGIDYQLRVNDASTNYSISIGAKNLVIQDHFFQHFNEEEGYLNTENIPYSINFFSNEGYNTYQLPVLYGQPSITSSGTSIFCKIDIFASSFFMLTRWEEHVNEERDNYDRFPLYASLAYKQGFYQRPVINEYCELLKSLLLELDSDLVFKKHKFRCIPTHDIDYLYKWSRMKQIRKKLAHHFLTEKRPLIGLKNVLNLIGVKIFKKNDPYQSFKYIVRLSKENSLTSRFYFMSGGTSKYDNNYSVEETQSIIQYLKENDQVIGIHPSYNSFNNQQQWHKEYKRLSTITGGNITEGRQHYLRFSVPHTWRIWNDNGMLTDSSMGYSEEPGFRCGSCYPFPVFDILKREKLGLTENPLIFMETSVISTLKLNPKEATELAKKLYFTVKKYDGNFTFLWHNSALLTAEDAPYKKLYENLIKGFPEHEN